MTVRNGTAASGSPRGRVVGRITLREEFTEAVCTPIPSGGWRVESPDGALTEHLHVGDPYHARDLHFASRGATE